jgi:hypothetical protein
MKSMATDLTVILADRPGTLAALGEALGNAGINIAGMCGFPCEGEGVLHILIEDADAARNALKQTGHEVRGEREVLVVEIEDRPGAFGEMARRIADAEVNFDLVYLAANTRLVVGASDLDKVRAIL